MYARMVTFRVKPGHRRQMEVLAEKSASYMRMAHGYRHVDFFVDEEAHEYGSLSVWDSRADIDKATEVLNPSLHEALKDIAEGAPTTRTFEVFEPK